MIKEALQYIVGLGQANIITIDDEQYSDKPLNRISYNPKAEPIKMTTLTSLIDYIKSDMDSDDLGSPMLIHVESPTCVKLISELDYEAKRECLVEVHANIPRFPFNEFMDHESFIIHMQSKFISNFDRGIVMQFAGTVEDGTVAQYSDDGVTQKATIKQGITGKTDAIIPNPVTLQPYRTFLEVEQPESQFIFRMKTDSRGITCAIFEADGGAWESEATKKVKEYLQAELSEHSNFTIIS